MKLWLLLGLCLSMSSAFPMVVKNEKKDLPQDIKLQQGSLVILKQYVEKNDKIRKDFPFKLSFTCTPELSKKNEKIKKINCVADDIHFAE